MQACMMGGGDLPTEEIATLALDQLAKGQALLVPAHSLHPLPACLRLCRRLLQRCWTNWPRVRPCVRVCRCSPCSPCCRGQGSCCTGGSWHRRGEERGGTEESHGLGGESRQSGGTGRRRARRRREEESGEDKACVAQGQPVSFIFSSR